MFRNQKPRMALDKIRENPPRVTSVTLNWQGRDVLLRCVESLKAQTLPLFEIIVVDNRSTDGSVQQVREKHPDVVILENPANFGAPKGRNVGLTRALEKEPDYIFTIDNDLYADPGCVENLVRAAGSDSTIAIVGAFIYDDGAPDRLLSAGAIVDFTQNVSRQIQNAEDLDRLYPLSYCGTGHMLTRSSVYRELGLLDEAFIGYGFEDSDFGFRTRGAGYRVVSYGRARVWHTAHAGIGRYSFKKKYLETRNAVLFMKRYGKWHQWMKYLVFVAIGFIAAPLIEIPKGHLHGVAGKFRGFWDGLTGKTELAERLLRS